MQAALGNKQTNTQMAAMICDSRFGVTPDSHYVNQLSG